MRSSGRSESLHCELEMLPKNCAFAPGSAMYAEALRECRTCARDLWRSWNSEAVIGTELAQWFSRCVRKGNSGVVLGDDLSFCVLVPRKTRAT